MTTTDVGTRISLKNILYGSDFSATAENAAAYTSQLARRFGSKIFALHVRSLEMYGMAPPESWPALRAGAQQQAQEEAARLDSLFCGLPHQAIVEAGDIWEVMSMLIEKHHIDLVVLGTHGRKGLGKMFVGSVAEGVLRRAPCPVLTVGPSVCLDVSRGIEMKSILFATDLSRFPDPAADYAVSLAQENQARLDIVHILDPRQRGPHADSSGLLVSCAHRMRSLVPPEAGLWCKPYTLVRPGRPAEEILSIARARGSQLIVLGVKAASGSIATSHAPWAIAHKIIYGAPCPVLTVRR